MADMDQQEMTDALREEIEGLTSTDRAAVLLLLLGEQEAANIIKYMDPKEVQRIGAAMVSAADMSQEAVNYVLDEFVSTLKKQTSLGLGTSDYVEDVLKRALGEDKAASVMGRILPGQASKGLEILKWMDARAIADMVRNEHPQVIAIILSVLEFEVAADVLQFLPQAVRPAKDDARRLRCCWVRRAVDVLRLHLPSVPGVPLDHVRGALGLARGGV